MDEFQDRPQKKILGRPNVSAILFASKHFCLLFWRPRKVARVPTFKRAAHPLLTP
jgi:hypothetical protein